MKLTPAQRKQLHSALNQAFPTWGDLRLFSDLELGLNLGNVTADQNVRTAALDLIYWALATGRLSDLIEAMCNERPDNQDVQACRTLLVQLRPDADSTDESAGNVLDWLK